MLHIPDTNPGLWVRSRECCVTNRAILAATRYRIAASRRQLNPAFILSGSSEVTRPEQSRLDLEIRPPKPMDLVLLAMARRALAEGKMPGGAADHLRGVPGGGAACSVCDLAITDETDMQLYFKDYAGGVMHHLHVRCVVAWESERWKLESQQLRLGF